MDYRKEFLVKPGSKVKLDDIDGVTANLRGQNLHREIQNAWRRLAGTC